LRIFGIFLTPTCRVLGGGGTEIEWGTSIYWMDKWYFIRSTGTIHFSDTRSLSEKDINCCLQYTLLISSYCIYVPHLCHVSIMASSGILRRVVL
jgi:hypothetical protein